MKNLFFVALLFSLATFRLAAQTQDQREINIILHEQTVAWNKGDLDTFMKGYWKNDSLMFIGKDGITHGYKNILNRYKKNYSDASKMGQLSFDLLQIKKLTNEYYFITGKWILKRTAGDVDGHYSLLFRKIKGKWVIICDHSS